MIWYFIAGFISGATGVFLLAVYLYKQTKGGEKDEIQREDRGEDTGKQEG